MFLRAAAAAAALLALIAPMPGAHAQAPAAGARSPATKADPKGKSQPLSVPAYPGGTRLRLRDPLGGARKRANGAGARSESHVYASKDSVAKLLAFYDAALTRQGFTRRSQSNLGSVGRLAAYARGTTSVSLQAYSDRDLWSSYLAEGEKAPPGTNGVFVVVTPGP